MSDLRRQNRGLVLGEILANGPTTRIAIASDTGLSNATVTRVVSALIDEDLVLEVETVAVEGRGRRPILLDARAELPVAVGIDFGVISSRVAAVALTGRLIAERRVETPVDATAEDLALWIARLAREVCGEAWAGVKCVAVGMPGVVHPVTTRVSLAPNQRQVEGSGFVEAAQRELERTVLFDNEANFALLGEMYSGAAFGHANAVMLTLDAGLGGSVAIEGRIFRGSTGIVGEYGSLPVAGGGAPLEDFLTVAGITRMAELANASIADPESIFLETSDSAILAVRSQFEQALVAAMTAAVVSVDPAVIVLGGRIAPALAGMTEELGRRVGAAVGVQPVIRLAEQGDLAGALGASAWALHHVLTGMDVPSRFLARIPRSPGKRGTVGG